MVDVHVSNFLIKKTLIDLRATINGNNGQFQPPKAIETNLYHYPNVEDRSIVKLKGMVDNAIISIGP